MTGAKSLLAFLLCVLLLPTDPAQAQSIHKNQEVGYQIRVPKDYQSAANSNLFGFSFGSNFVVDSFKRERGIAVKDSYFDFDLRMMTFFFPDENTVPTKQEGSVDGKTVKVTFTGTMYRNFKDFAQDRVTGFFFTKEKKQKIGGKPAVLYEMKFEKLATVPQLWLACSYEVPGGEFAVMFTAPEQHYQKLAREFLPSIKSFKVLNKSGLKPGKSSGFVVDFGEIIDRPDDDASDEVKAEWRKRKTEERFERVIAELEPGWFHTRSENFLIVSEVDAGFTKKVQKHAEGIHRWMDKKYGKALDGAVDPTVIRVYTDQNSAGGALRSFSINGRVNEIPVYKKDPTFDNNPMANMSPQVAQQWIACKSPELWKRMPHWLKSGLGFYLNNAQVRGSKVVFPRGEVERYAFTQIMNDVKKFKKSGTGKPALCPLNDLFKTTRDQFWGNPDYTFLNMQSSGIIRFMLEGPGRSWGKSKNLIGIYISTLFEEVQAVEKKLEQERKSKKSKKKDKEDMTEEELLAAEDEAYQKKRSQAFDQVEKEMLDRVFERVFGHWTTKDWQKLQITWEKYAGKLAG